MSGGGDMLMWRIGRFQWCSRRVKVRRVIIWGISEGRRMEKKVRRRIFMMAMFKAKKEGLNQVLKERINETGMIYLGELEG